MRLQKMFALAVALTLAGCGGERLDMGPISPALQRSLASVHVDPAAATAMLTAYRASHGLGAVRLDPALTQMAQRQADAMVAANSLSHDVSGGFASRIMNAGVDTPRAAENIGGGYYSTDEAFKGWRESPQHNANLLMPQATRFGIAVAKDARTHFKVYWAMEVAADPDKPSSKPAALMISGGPPLAVGQ